MIMPSRANRKRKARDVRHLNEPHFVAPAGVCPLSAYINFNFEMHRQTTEDYNKKDEIRCWVEDCLHQAGYDEYSCYMVGSTSNGFGTRNSDVDICLVVDHNTVNKNTNALSYKKSRKWWIKVNLWERSRIAEKHSDNMVDSRIFPSWFQQKCRYWDSMFGEYRLTLTATISLVWETLGCWMHTGTCSDNFVTR